MADSRHFEDREIAIFQQRFDRSTKMWLHNAYCHNELCYVPAHTLRLLCYLIKLQKYVFNNTDFSSFIAKTTAAKYENFIH